MYNEVVELPFKVFKDSVKNKRNDGKIKKKDKKKKKQGNQSFSHPIAEKKGITNESQKETE